MGKRIPKDGPSEASRRIEMARARSTSKLNLSSLDLSELPTSLWELSQLRELDLSANSLASVPGSLGRLRDLQKLSLRGNGLIRLPQSIGDLSHLRDLFLCNNQLDLLPESMARCHRLQRLHIGGNQLSLLPPWLGELNQLRDLDARNNQLSSLPPTLTELLPLQKLDVRENRLTSLPESIGVLLQLRELTLSMNLLEYIPESVGNLRALRVLDLSRNPVRHLPPSMSKLAELRELYLHGSEDLRIPPEVLGPSRESVIVNGATPADPAAVLRYYLKVRLARRPLNEVKLILMGRGGVGKTSIVNRLARNEFDPDSARTEGIQITKWSVKVGRDAVELNVWDFGGQEIMHATHQFFLSERSVYLVVLSGREGSEDEDAEYWLKLAATFGAGSPAIVVLNKSDEQRFDVNRRALQQKYSNLRQFVATDCSTGLGIENLGQAIRKALTEWKAWRVDFPTAWFDIKDRLSGMPESYLSFAEFQNICSAYGERDSSAQVALAGYLHDLGIALNYKDDPRLRDTHVLNPHWVTGGIYRILNAEILASTTGVLHVDQLDKILPQREYPKNMHMFLLDLMRKFELCFPFPDESARYLVPELLDKQQPAEAERFSPEECLGFEYHYPILPEGVLPRFIVRSHALSEGQPRWRSGVILQFEGCRSLVKADVQDKRVQVLVDGSADNRRRLLAVIRSDFARIHASIPDLGPQEMVPAPRHPEHLIEYRKLVVLEQKGRTQFEELIGDDVVMIQVTHLLNGVDLSRSQRRAHWHAVSDSALKVFYSYSHKDEQLKNELETHLKILERVGLISPWHDRLIRPGDDWEGEIDVNLDIADLILLLVSADFIASDYCYSREMKVALQRESAGKARVIPIILRDCNWKDAPFGNLQGLPRDMRAVTLWENRDTAWRDVSEGIERAINSIRSRRQAGGT